MIIINQWATDHVEYNNDPIEIGQENDKFDLFVSDSKVASLADIESINILYDRLMHFVENYRRITDTFDIAVELNQIKKHKTYSYGGYSS